MISSSLFVSLMMNWTLDSLSFSLVTVIPSQNMFLSIPAPLITHHSKLYFHDFLLFALFDGEKGIAGNGIGNVDEQFGFGCVE